MHETSSSSLFRPNILLAPWTSSDFDVVYDRLLSTQHNFRERGLIISSSCSLRVIFGMQSPKKLRLVYRRGRSLRLRGRLRCTCGQGGGMAHCVTSSGFIIGHKLATSFHVFFPLLHSKVCRHWSDQTLPAWIWKFQVHELNFWPGENQGVPHGDCWYVKTEAYNMVGRWNGRQGKRVLHMNSLEWGWTLREQRSVSAFKKGFCLFLPSYI